MDNKFFLREKRCEYILKLEELTTNIFLTGITLIYDDVKKSCKLGKNLLKEFQNELRNIKNWDDDFLGKELKRFRTESKCEIIDTLILSIFKIFYLTNGIKEAKYPSVKKYIHECYLNVARKLYKDPYLLYDVGVSSKEKRRNIHAIEDIIKKCINDTFIQMLPFTPIDVYEGKDNSDDDEGGEEEGDEDEDEVEDEDGEDGEDDEEEDGDEDDGEEDGDEEEEDNEEDDEEDEEGEEDDEDGDEDEEEDDDDEEDEEGDEDDEEEYEDEDEDDDEEEDEEDEEGEDEDEDEEEGDEDEGDEDEGDEDEGEEDDEEEDEDEGEDEGDEREEGDKEEEGEKKEVESSSLVEVDKKKDVKVVEIEAPKNKKKGGFLEKKQLIKDKLLKTHNKTDSFY